MTYVMNATYIGECVEQKLLREMGTNTAINSLKLLSARDGNQSASHIIVCIVGTKQVVCIVIHQVVMTDCSRGHPVDLISIYRITISKKAKRKCYLGLT